MIKFKFSISLKLLINQSKTRHGNINFAQPDPFNLFAEQILLSPYDFIIFQFLIFFLFYCWIHTYIGFRQGGYYFVYIMYTYVRVYMYISPHFTRLVVNWGGWFFLILKILEKVWTYCKERFTYFYIYCLN